MYIYINIYIYIYKTLKNGKLEDIERHIRSCSKNQQSAISSTKIYVSHIFRKLIISILFSYFGYHKSDHTCNYLYLDKEIHVAKPLKILEPCAGQKLKNQNRVKQT